MTTSTSITEILRRANATTRTLAAADPERIKKVLLKIADRMLERRSVLLAANARDLARMAPSDPKYDRLLLNDQRLTQIADDMRRVANMTCPLGRVLEERLVASGLHLSKIAVPLGVVGIVYEARPNVTWDVVALCLKTGNCVVLKGGADAQDSNAAAVAVIGEVLAAEGIGDAVALLPPTRTAVEELLHAVGLVDVVIPRGSQQLIDYVRQESRVPVIETGAGVVHVYVDATVDVSTAARVIFNSKTRRVSVCNALDTLIVHRLQLPQLHALVAALATKEVEILADEASKQSLAGKYPNHLLKSADSSAFGTEFLDYRMAIKTVDSLEEALDHIAKYSSRHSEAILSDNSAHIERFLKEVDAACVYANASTAFTDGGEFGMGAEIGISTQKLHARGPMGLPELCSYKWLIRGNGNTRT